MVSRACWVKQVTANFDNASAREPGDALLARLNDTYRLLEANGRKLASVEGELASRLNEIVQFYDHAPVGIAMLDREGRFVRVNDRLAGMAGARSAEFIGHTIAEAMPGLGTAAADIVAQVLATGEGISRQRVIGTTPDHAPDPRVYEIICYPVGECEGEGRGKDGRATCVGMMVEDVTERVQREEQTRQVLHELQHRVKNSLANVLALVEQARRSDGEKEDVLDTLRERMRALSRIHSLLTDCNWSAIPLRALLESELSALPAGRTGLDGPDVSIGAQPALALATAVHELASNAVRFGGLAGEVGGRVDIDWRLDGDRLRIEWRETGTSVGQKATGLARMGFGSRLIMASIQDSLRGELTRDVLPNGLVYRIDLPVKAIAPRGQPFHLKKSLFRDHG